MQLVLWNAAGGLVGLLRRREMLSSEKFHGFSFINVLVVNWAWPAVIFAVTQAECLNLGGSKAIPKMKPKSV